MARKSMVELLSQLTVDFPDNAIGAITPAILRGYYTDFINAVRPAYALLERQLGVAQAVTTVDAPLVFTSADITSANGEMTATAVSGQIGRVDKGTTRFTFTADLLQGTNSARTITFTLYEAGVPTIWAQSIVLSSNTQIESLTFTALVYEATAVNYSMQVKSSVNETITFSNMALIAEIVPVNSY
jgi:hypothetical protein